MNRRLTTARLGGLGTVVFMGEPHTLDMARCPGCRMPVVLVASLDRPERRFMADRVTVAAKGQGAQPFAARHHCARPL